MQIVKYLTDRIRRTFGGEKDVVTDAEAAGLRLAEGGETRSVLYARFDEEDASGAPDPSRMSLYLIRFPAQGRFLVRTVREQVPHGLETAFESVLAAGSEKGPTAEEWWGQVFFRGREGRLEPAAELDEIRASETDSRTMEEFVGTLRGVIGEWIPARASIRYDAVILSSPSPLYTCLPLQYAVQEELSSEVMAAEPSGPWMDWTGKDYHSFFYTPKALRYGVLHTTPELQVVNLFDRPFTVTLPVTKGLVDAELLSGVKVRDLFNGDMEPDYQTGSLGFKRVTLKASPDAYGALYFGSSSGNTLRLGLSGDSFSILASSSSRPVRRSKYVKTPGNPEIPANETGNVFRLAENRPRSEDELAMLSEEELREEKDRLEKLLDYDVILTDTNIWMRPGKTNAEGAAQMRYAGMLFSLARLQYGKRPAQTGFEVPYEVKEELYHFQLDNSHADDRAWLRNKRIYDNDGARKAELGAVAHQAMIMLDSLATHQPYPMVSIRCSGDGSGKKDYADPHLVDRCMELAPSKSVLLVTDDKELRIEVATKVAALRADKPEVRQPMVVGGRDLANVTSSLSRVKKELCRRTA